MTISRHGVPAPHLTLQLRGDPRVRVLHLGGPAFAATGLRTSLQESLMARTFGRSVSATAIALLVVATACNDFRNPQSPKIEAWGAPPPETGELRGVGFIGSGSDVQTFGFDVQSMQARITGLFLGAEPSTSATLITGPTEPGTTFTAFRSSSSFCSNPSQGAEFDAVGHLVEPSVDVYVAYTIKGCDNGPPGFGVDTWSVDIPSRSYHKDGSVTGDIMKQ